jgi:uncharacterized Zn finger protein
MYRDYTWKPYVPVAERRRLAAQEMAKRTKKGETVRPVVVTGKTIATTFWGKAWCENLERYSDFSNRLPRGRTYVRNGSVVDLALHPGKVVAQVMGSDLYSVTITIEPLPQPQWKTLRAACAGAIDSLVELLQGRFAKGVMERICDPQRGMFPSPRQIKMNCSCPDWATMCKHVAAVLYGVGNRLDVSPELFFLLRQVDQRELIAVAGKGLTTPKVATKSDRVLADTALSDLFGIELNADEPIAKKAKKKTKVKKRTPRRSPREE